MRFRMLAAVAAMLLCGAPSVLAGCQNAAEGESDTEAVTAVAEPAGANTQVAWPHADLLDPDIAAIVERGTLRVAMLPDTTGVFNNAADAEGLDAATADASDPDASDADNASVATGTVHSSGSLRGIDVEMAKNLAASLGVELVIDTNYATYDQLLSSVLAGKADVIVSNMSVTPQRAAYVAFSDPYLTDHVALMANKSMLVEQGIENNPLDYLRSNRVRIGVLEGSSYVGIAERQFPQAELVLMDSEDHLVEAVADGQLFGYLSNDADFVYYFTSDPVNSLYTQVFAFADAPESVCFAVAPEKTGLLAYLNAYLETTETLTVEDVEAYCRDLFDY